MNHERQFHHFLDALRNPDGIARIAHVFEQYDELISSEPRDGSRVPLQQAEIARARYSVCFPDASPQPLPELDDHNIARVMAQGFVDYFQIVQVEKQERRMRFGMTFLAIEYHLQPVHEDGAIRQLGEQIVRRVEVQNFLRFLVARNIAGIEQQPLDVGVVYQVAKKAAS